MVEIQTKFKSEKSIDILGLPFPRRKLLPRGDDVSLLPHTTPDLYLKGVEYVNKERELRNKIRDWSLINEKHAKQDLYTWDLLSFAVDCLISVRSV